MSEHDCRFDNDIDRCAHALHNVHAFLHGELSELASDVIRQHLIACERCLDNFQAEEMLTKLLQRCCGGVDANAPEVLRARVNALAVQLA
ncbi:MAG: zf-HC2 domain-containing protein [Propionibacteriaceae bacterium]|jgi:anti-sigma factor (TIGR02949 family)|nr:zf-HC2 domain-containing protein [Propionibacteriaceae bacterium]